MPRSRPSSGGGCLANGKQHPARRRNYPAGRFATTKGDDGPAGSVEYRWHILQRSRRLWEQRRCPAGIRPPKSQRLDIGRGGLDPVPALCLKRTAGWSRTPSGCLPPTAQHKGGCGGSSPKNPSDLKSYPEIQWRWLRDSFLLQEYRRRSDPLAPAHKCRSGRKVHKNEGRRDRRRCAPR